ncbi:MAG: DUF4203 domain-containing protein [Proteobacteria bacterium]|nr:DUF4203 domain-containing protein [Pseudomonadota bacterium]
MNALEPIFLISLAGGLAVLFFGRRLFWLYIGLVGVLAGFELSQTYFPDMPYWLSLTIAIILGVIMAVLAIALQYVAMALAGFVGGAYVALQIMTLLPAIDVSQLPEWLLLVPGVFGALICLVVFNPALIVLSSFTGAAVLAQLVPLDPLLQNGLMLVLALVGMGFQFVVYKRRDEE